MIPEERLIILIRNNFEDQAVVGEHLSSLESAIGDGALVGNLISERSLHSHHGEGNAEHTQGGLTGSHRSRQGLKSI